MVITDANKMQQNVAFPGTKFANFLGRGLPTPERNAFEEFLRLNRRLSFQYSLSFWSLSYNS